MSSTEEYLKELKALFAKEVKIIKELGALANNLESTNLEEEGLMNSQSSSLKDALGKTSELISNILEDMNVTRPLPSLKVDIPKKAKVEKKVELQKKEEIPLTIKRIKHEKLGIEISELEKKILKRLRKEEKETKVITKKRASKYVSVANKTFGEISRKLQDKRIFVSLKQDLIKANLDFIPTSYISVLFFTTMIALIGGFVLFLFLMFFSLGPDYPFVTKVVEGMGKRFLETFWIIFVVPLLTFLGVYTYPSVEKSYLEGKINQELPFATIHMAAISGSMVEPSKMFSIIIATGDYPFMQKEFIKLINQINIYGYDFVTALRNVAFNNPSQRLAELLNGLATTINSGGDLPNFFEKRAQTLLFDYRIEREKYTKTAETFMDIYISLVIAAPMILMLLLIMMSVSGLGLSIGTSTITLLMIFGVSMLNLIFLAFLKLKQPAP